MLNYTYTFYISIFRFDIVSGHCAHALCSKKETPSFIFELPVQPRLSLSTASVCGGVQSLRSHFSSDCVQLKHGALRDSVCPCNGLVVRPGCRGETARPCHRGENTCRVYLGRLRQIAKLRWKCR